MENTTENYFIDKSLGRLHCVQICKTVSFSGALESHYFSKLLTNNIRALPGCVIIMIGWKFGKPVLQFSKLICKTVLMA